MNVVIYERVSTKTQDYDRQLSELRKNAARMQHNVVREFAEVVSGAKKRSMNEKRFPNCSRTVTIIMWI